jgi:hypothetical protein
MFPRSAKVFRKMLDRLSEAVPIFKTSPQRRRSIFLEKTMIRSWTHTNLRLTASAAFREMRTGTGFIGGVCLRPEDMNYQPKPNGTDRLEMKD